MQFDFSAATYCASITARLSLDYGKIKVWSLLKIVLMMTSPDYPIGLTVILKKIF